MLVRIHYDHSKGKTSEIVSRSGSSLLQSRVFDALLRDEVETSKLLAHEGSLLTTHNYSFRLIGQAVLTGRRCYLLELNPLRRDKHLLQGRAWVDTEDYGVVHIEPLLRPSQFDSS
jgi:outer membrane lipoprotein-sorting protein